MYQKYVKRSLDMFFTIVIILFTIPIALVVAALIKLHDGGPIIFKQKRFGRNKQPFTIYKFRTMSTDAPSDSPTNSLKDAHGHITRPGKIIRKLSLDELPQVINVVKGEMSIIGPRPVVLKEVDLIAEREKFQANDCRPGITGWAQVNGRDELHLEKKAKLDGEYIQKLGFWMDVKCVLMTIYTILFIRGHREGANEEDVTTRTYRSEQENG